MDFKEYFSIEKLKEFAKIIADSDKIFDKNDYIKSLMKEIPRLEMKDRVRLASKKLSEQYSRYPRDIKKLTKLIEKGKITSFNVWIVSEYIEKEGLDYLEESLEAMVVVTKAFSAEFCIRPFIEKYPVETYRFLKDNLNNDSEHVRRWISEGTRPLLPWGMKVDYISKNYRKNIVLLNKLYQDDSEYVRRSVANHLNDISKFDKQLVLDTVKKWDSDNKDAKKLIRHALRTLIKKGDKETLEFLGYKKVYAPKRISSSVDKTKLSRKETLNLKIKFFLKKEARLIIDYTLFFVGKKEGFNEKVFKWKDISLSKGEHTFEKKLNFKDNSIRKYYPGMHKIEIQINGKKYKELEFLLE